MLVGWFNQVPHECNMGKKMEYKQISREKERDSSSEWSNRWWERSWNNLAGLCKSETSVDWRALVKRWDHISFDTPSRESSVFANILRASCHCWWWSAGWRYSRTQFIHFCFSWSSSTDLWCQIALPYSPIHHFQFKQKLQQHPAPVLSISPGSISTPSPRSY